MRSSPLDLDQHGLDAVLAAGVAAVGGLGRAALELHTEAGLQGPGGGGGGWWVGWGVRKGRLGRLDSEAKR